jgi:hypothetical protein
MGCFCDATCCDAVGEDLLQKDASRNTVREPFFHGNRFMRLGVSCYPTALLFNQTTIFCKVPEIKRTPSPAKFWALRLYNNGTGCNYVFTLRGRLLKSKMFRPSCNGSAIHASVVFLY